MATSTGYFCGPCDTRHVTTVALVWCLSCNEGLCTTCSEHHSSSKGTRHHQTLPVSQYLELESLLTSIQQDCESHGRKLDFYCLDHNSPCCVSCIPVQHSRCKNVKPMDELSKQARRSDALPEIERGLKELHKTITEIKLNQQENSEKIQKQGLNIVKEIKAMKLKVKDYLDRLESEILNELGEISKKEKSRIDSLLEELQNKELCIQQLVTTVKHLNCLPDIQNFLASKELEARLNDEEKWTTDVCSNGQAVDTDIKISFNQELEKIMSEIKTIAEIQVSNNPIQIKVGTWKEKQSQISVPTVTTRRLEDIRLQVVRQIEFEDSVNIRDCFTLPDGKMIFAQYNGDKLLIYNEDGRFCKKITTGSGPHGLVVIDINAVAVSCRGDKIVQIIDIITGVVKKTIKVGRTCRGLSYNKGKLYVLVKNSGIMEYDVDGDFIRTIPVDVPTSSGFLCCCSDGFCYTRLEIFGSNFIACCDVNGKLFWKSGVGNVGVTVDNTGNIYVANYNTNSLSVMSADGKRTKRLLCKDDELYNPGVYITTRRMIHYWLLHHVGKRPLCIVWFSGDILILQWIFILVSMHNYSKVLSFEFLVWAIFLEFMVSVRSIFILIFLKNFFTLGFMDTAYLENIFQLK